MASIQYHPDIKPRFYVLDSVLSNEIRASLGNVTKDAERMCVFYCNEDGGTILSINFEVSSATDNSRNI
jgi:hypothetical protein